MEFLLALITSRAGPLVIAFTVGLSLGWWQTSSSWRKWENTQQKIRDYNLQVEKAREAQNAVEIAKAATERVEQDSQELAKLRKQISDFDQEEANAKNPCVIDDRFRDVAGRLQPARPRPVHPKITRPAR